MILSYKTPNYIAILSRKSLTLQFLNNKITKQIISWQTKRIIKLMQQRKS